MAIEFTIVSAQQTNLWTVRVTFSRPPVASSTSGEHDALNATLYSISGPSFLQITDVSRVSGDPYSVDLVLSGSLSVGTWTIELSADIYAYGDTPLEAPHEIEFTVTALSLQEGAHRGAVQESAADVLRKNFNPVFRNKKNWSALIEALATGDKNNREAARSAFNQLFLSTASGSYLNQRAAEHGVSRPTDVGLSDAGIMGDIGFRQYAIRLSNGGLTQQSLLEVLEVFYGTDAVMAYANSSLSEPYVLENGDDLIVSIDGRSITTTFVDADFASISSAKAVEIAAALNRSFDLNSSQAFAVPIIDPETQDISVRIYSGSRGLASSVEVTGGKAQVVLQYDTLIDTHTVAPWPVWDITLDPATDRLRFSPDSTFDMSLVQVGDYVTVYGAVFDEANRGTYEVVEVYWAYPGAVLTQWFEVENRAGVSQAALAQVNKNDLLVFRPKHNTIHNDPERSVQITSIGNELDIVLPATSSAVDREELSGAYIQAGEGNYVSNTTLTRRADGRVTVDTVDAHQLAVGDWVYLDGVIPSTASPPVTAAATGQSESSLATIWAEVDDGPNVGMVHSSVCKLGDGRALIAGGHDPALTIGRIYNSLAGTASLLGEDASTFSIQAGATYNLAKDEQSTITVRYAPTSSDTHSAKLLVPNSQLKEIQLAGVCSTGPKVSVKKVYCRLGDTVQIRVTGGGGSTTDWVAMYYTWEPPSAAALARAGSVWQFMNGTQVAPGAPIAAATLTFTPLHEGPFYIVFQSNNTYTVLATSPVLTVSNQPLSELIPKSLDFGGVASGETTDLDITVCNNTAAFVGQADKPCVHTGTSSLVDDSVWHDMPYAPWETEVHSPGHHVLSARLVGITGSGKVATIRLLMDGAVVSTQSTNRLPIIGGYYQCPTLYFPVNVPSTGTHTFKLQWRSEYGILSVDGVASGNYGNRGNCVYTLLPFRAVYSDEATATGAGSESLAVSGAWTDIAKFPVWTRTFAAGTYTLITRVSGINAGGSGKYKLRVLVDGVPLTGDGGDMPTSTGYYTTTNLVLPVTLTAASHTFKIQWYRETGSTLYLDGEYFGIPFGSREFILLNTTVVAQDDQGSSGAGAETISTTTWTDFANCPTWTVTPGAGSYILAVSPRGFYTGNPNQSLGWLRVLVDGTEISVNDGGKIGWAPGNYMEPTFYIPVKLSAGAHTFKIQGRGNYGGYSIKFDGTSGGFNYGSRVFTLLAAPPNLTVTSTDDTYTFRVDDLVEVSDGKFRADHTVTVQPDMATAVSGAVATVGNSASGSLFEGKAIITGGTLAGATAVTTCRIYDSATDTWAAGGSLNTARWGHAQSIIPSNMTPVPGRILVTGGSSGYMGAALASVELYNPFTNTWTAKTSMATARADHAQITLSKGYLGNVLVTGGRTMSGSNVVFNHVSECGPCLNTGEMYVTDMNTWQPTGAMSWCRFGHQMVEIEGGKVLVIGGYGRKPHQPNSTPVAIRDIEIWDSNNFRWYPAGRLLYDRPYPIVRLLADGTVLVAGGLSETSEIFDPSTGRSTVAGKNSLYRPFSQGISLDNELTLMVGGEDADSKLRLRIPAANAFIGGGLNGIFRVVEVLDSDTFVIETPDRKQYTLNVGTEAIVTRFAAE